MNVRHWTVGIVGTVLVFALAACRDGTELVAPLEPEEGSVTDVVVTQLPAPQLLQPDGSVTQAKPEFTWKAVTGSTRYQVFIRDGTTATGTPRVNRAVGATDAGCGEGTGVCAWTSDTELSNGSGLWWVQGWNEALKDGEWSVARSISVEVPRPPGAVTLVAPSGDLQEMRPEFRWNATPTATRYRVQVRHTSSQPPNAIMVDERISAATAQCSSGAGICRWTAPTDLAPGLSSWWVQTWNEHGGGPWSPALSISVARPPDAVSLVAPSGDVHDLRPEFRWNATPTATRYRVQVRDISTQPPYAVVIDERISAATAQCSSGAGTCRWTAPMDLAPGLSSWWVQTWNKHVGGPWSPALSISVSRPPDAVALVAPSGDIHDMRPEFRWNATPTATRYRVQVRDASSQPPNAVVMDERITAATAQCSSGTGTCRWTAPRDLAPGLSSWWVQTRNEHVGGPWSPELKFRLSPRAAGPGFSYPPPPGPNDRSSGWTGNTIPLRIIEGGSQTGRPVPVTIIANGQARTFHRSSVSQGRTINVPRHARLTVIAHFTPNPAVGLGHFGFSALKLKGMNYRWGFQPHQVNHSNNPSWERYTNNGVPGQPYSIPGWTWGGSLTGMCGSMPPGHADAFWRYTIPSWVPTARGVDFLVVWLLDHQYPRHVC